jgi:iron(III) transport system substrate-binding protein
MQKLSGRKSRSVMITSVLLLVVCLITACGSVATNSSPAPASTATNSSPAPAVSASSSSSSAASGSSEFETMSMQDLEAGAKKEGGLVWYAAMSTSELDGISKKFMEKYPDIKVQYINLAADTLPSRVMTEQKGGKYNADVISASGWPMQQVKLAKSLEKYISPEVHSLSDGVTDPDGYWVGHFSLTFPIVYNPNKVKELGLQPPKSYQDLTKPEWKGLFAVERTDYEWYAAMLKAYGNDAKTLMENLGKNKPQQREGHTVVLQGVISGEYPAAISAYGFKASAEKAKGEPIDFVNPDPTITELQPVGIGKNAPHPYAARLFETWLISSEGQKFLLDKYGRTPTRSDVTGSFDVYDPKLFHYYISDPSSGTDYANIAKQFKKVFGIGG